MQVVLLTKMLYMYYTFGYFVVIVLIFVIFPYHSLKQQVISMQGNKSIIDHLLSLCEFVQLPCQDELFFFIKLQRQNHV